MKRLLLPMFMSLSACHVRTPLVCALLGSLVAAFGDGESSFNEADDGQLDR